MKNKLHVFIIVILLAAGFGVSTKTALADGPIPDPTCNSVTFTGITNGGGPFTATLDVTDPPGSNNVVGSATITYAAGGNDAPVTGSGTFNAPVGDTIGVSGFVTWTVPPCTSGGTSNAVTFCDLSEDGRLDAKCGDRIALYCNDEDPTPNLDVWVIDTTSVGHELVELPLDSLVPTFTKNLGANGILNGGSDADGNGWISLSGGPYGGTGSGDWAKTFTCSAG